MRTRSRFTLRAVTALAALLSLPVSTQAQTELHSVETHLTSPLERTVIDNVTFWQSVAAGYQVRHVPEESYYYIRFAEDEPFEFRIGKVLVDDGGGGRLFTWDHDQNAVTPALQLQIPSNVLTLRASLLAARQYWNTVCERAGLPQKFAEDGPIRVWIPSWLTTPRNSLGLARYHSHEIMLWREGQSPGVAAHEYFHLLQGAISARKHRELWNPLPENNKRLTFLEEATADWAMDEPIRIPFPNGSTYDLDEDDNSYLIMGSHLFRYGDRPLLNREGPAVGYLECLLPKYFSEQAGGGSDAGKPEAVLQWIANSLEAGPPDAPHLLEELAKLLPERFGGTWQQRWRRFHGAFRMSNIIQKGGSATDHPKLLGYHDNAFQTFADKPAPDQTDSNPGPEGEMYPVALGEDGPLRRDYLRVPARLYKEPATRAQQRERLQEYLEHHAIAPQATLTRLIDPNLPAAGGAELGERPVFVFARSEDGASVFLLEQRTREPDHLGRDSARFRWEEDFELEQNPSVKPESLSLVTHAPDPGERIYLWCGLVNNAVDLEGQSVTWTYLAAPRLLAYSRASEPGRVTRTVELIEGDPVSRGSAAGFFNGDQFKFQVDVSGPLHLGPLTQNDIAEENRTLAVQLVGPAEAAIKLSPEGVRVDALQLDDRETVRYTISGRIAADNPVAGSCLLRIRQTSLFNLGEGDEQTDESFTFQLRAGVPAVQRFRVSSGGEVNYDSGGGVHRAAKPAGGTFTLEVEVTFTEPMDPASVTITAGGEAPYSDLAVQNLRWEGNLCRGMVRLAKSAAPQHGMLTFAVAGADRAGTPLDADAYREGAQPDTGHFALLELAELDRFQIELQATQTHDGDHAPGVPEHEVVTCDGLRLNFNLVPRTGSHGMRFAGSQCDRILRNNALKLKNLNFTHGSLKQELEGARANPAKAIAPQLQKLRTKFNIERSVLNSLRGRPDLIDPDNNLAEREAGVARMKKDIAAVEADPSGAALVTMLERDLEEAGKAILTAEEEKRRVLAAARVTQGIKVYEARGPAATPKVIFRGGKFRRSTEGQVTVVTSPPWKAADGGATRIQGYSSLELIIMLAGWEDLADVELLIREKHPLGKHLANFLWSFWPLRERPPRDSLVVPPLRSNMLSILRFAGSPSFNFPSSSQTTYSNGKVNAREETFSVRISRDPSLGMGGPVLSIIPSDVEFSTRKVPVIFAPWTGDPLDFAGGNLHLYGQPSASSFQGQASGAARMEGVTYPDQAPDSHAWRWRWRWSLQHVGEESGIRPQPRP